MQSQYDDAVVGAGILGLAHAYHLAKLGRRVIVFERSPRAMGASVRNFGMLWPIGQPAGRMQNLALRSREIWLEILQSANIWHERTGSLHLAYRDDEAQVLREFVETAGTEMECEFLDRSGVLARSDAVRSNGLIAGLWSATETCVDPREVIANLPGWLKREYGVEFVFDATVTDFEAPRVTAKGEEWHAERLFVCAGDDIQTLYPRLLQAEGFRRCKLQMMRSQPYGGSWKLGPMLAAGLTLQHYRAFERCPSLAALRRRIADEMPIYNKFGIHVMASQNGNGEIVIGDSHEYDTNIEPFDRQEIDDLILNYLQTFLEAPGIRVASHWNGVYLKHPIQPYFIAKPAPGATIVTGVGGAGMTLSFGLAEEAVNGPFD